MTEQQALHDGQTQTGAFTAGGEEGIEDLLPVLCRDARTIVLKSQADLRVAFQDKPDPVGPMLQGIVSQITQDTLQGISATRYPGLRRTSVVHFQSDPDLQQLCCADSQQIPRPG